MINLTLSNSLKKIISKTLNDRIDNLRNNETKIKSVSSKLDFYLALEPINDELELTVKVKELENLNNELYELLPEFIYVSDLRFN